MFEGFLVSFPKNSFSPLSLCILFSISPPPWLSSVTPLSPSPCHRTCLYPPPPPPPQAEQASLSHILDLLSLILLSAIWALCPRDSLALLGQWVQDKLSQVRSRVLLSERRLSPHSLMTESGVWNALWWCSDAQIVCLSTSWCSVIPTAGNWKPRLIKLDCS